MLIALQGHCQSKDGDKDSARPDQDTLTTQVSDSTSTAISDTIVLNTEEGDLSTTIIYTAEDSMVMDVPNRKVYLYGKAKVEWGDVNMTAAIISIDWNKNEMSAQGAVDSTGRYRDKPYFIQGEDEYVIDSIIYNINSEKGILYNIVTEQDGGYIKGDVSKRTKDAVYVKTGEYTTCNLAHPHFYIKAHKLKVIPEREIVSGPFHMVISDIPTPIGFPLAFFPIVDKGKSGVIFPTIGENRSRGFFISRGGYYFKVKEKMGISLIGDIYSNGSFLGTLNTTYKSRYKFDGNFSLNLSRVRDGYGDDSINPFSNQYNVRWVHTSSSNSSGRFSANVNMSSSSFYSQNSYDPTRVQSNTFNSAVSYSKTIRNSPFNYTISANQDQNVQTKVMRVTLPNLSVNMNRIYPLRRKVGSGTNWYEKIAFQVTGNSSYSFTNVIHDYRTNTDSVYNFTDTTYQKILNNGTLGAKWDIPVSATFNLFKYFNVTPSFNYTEYWYAKRLNYAYDGSVGRAIPEFEEGFFRTSQYNFRVNVNTWVYGKWINRGGGALRGVLHSINPIVSYTYNPDFSKSDNNYQRFSQSVDYNGNEIKYNRYSAAPYGGPGSGISNVIDWEIRNIVEAKWKSKKDTSETSGKKIKLLENLSLASKYDFTKDTLKMGFIFFNARTRIFLFDINFNSTFDPYTYIADTLGGRDEGIRVNRYAYAEGQGLAKLTSLNFNVSRTFKPKSKKGSGVATSTADKLTAINTQEARNIVSNPNEYVDFNLPWSLAVRYAYGYTKNGLEAVQINQSLSFDASLNLSEKWKLTTTTSYDFINKGIGYTSMTIYRDLHCWQASFTCIPVGPRQSYFFTFNAKSTLLQDLKLNKRSPAFFAQY